jgi:hypothetical protein
MNYSDTGIANMALQRIGARAITSFQDDSPNAIKINNIWDMIFQEVLSERDWKFAKTRAQLQKNSVTPVGGYRSAYSLPTDFLRLVRPREKPEEHRIADANLLGWGWGSGGWGWYHYRDLPIWPREVAPYIVETVQQADTAYATCLLTNYCGTHPVTMNYIRLITDYTQLLPGFVNCMANRLAGELAIPITEDKSKAEGFMEKYLASLNSAQSQQECDDYLKDESGSNSWVEAGRYWGRGYW